MGRKRKDTPHIEKITPENVEDIELDPARYSLNYIKVKRAEQKRARERIDNRYLYASKYDDSYPQLVIDMFKRGETIAMFCSKINVCKRTVDRWLKPDEENKLFKGEFYAAYHIALAHQEAFYDKVMIREIENPSENFNPVLYQMIRRNLHGWTEHRKILTLEQLQDAGTYQQQEKVLRTALANGELTPAEFHILAKSIVALAQMAEIDTLKAEIDELKAYVKNEIAIQQTQDNSHG